MAAAGWLASGWWCCQSDRHNKLSQQQRWISRCRQASIIAESHMYKKECIMPRQEPSQPASQLRTEEEDDRQRHFPAKIRPKNLFRIPKQRGQEYNLCIYSCLRRRRSKKVTKRSFRMVLKILKN